MADGGGIKQTGEAADTDDAGIQEQPSGMTVKRDETPKDTGWAWMVMLGEFNMFEFQ